MIGGKIKLSGLDLNKAIEIHGLSKKYGDFLALKGVSFSVNRGEIFALLGPNGAGKTTLFSILATLKRASSGDAFVLGHDVNKEKEAIRKEIGIVFQEPALDEILTARENLSLMARFYGFTGKKARERADQVLEMLDLKELAGRKPRKMSGGQKRKLELARAIIPKPELLFLDEATLGLDVDARRNFWQEIKRLAGDGSTIFLTTHYMEEAEIADRIAMIADGSIIALDHPKILKAGVGDGVVRLETEDNDVANNWLKLQQYNTEIHDGSIWVIGGDPAALLPGILEQMPKKVLRVEIRQPSLEDAFMHLTGQHLKNNTGH